MITNSTISNNTTTAAAGFSGAGIESRAISALTIEDTTISGNTANLMSSGLHVVDVSGPVLLNRVVISNNNVLSFGGAGGGGFEDVAGGLTIQSSTISGNTGAVGGLGFANVQGGINVIRSTVSGNEGTVGASGLRFDNTDAVVLENATVSGNFTADFDTVVDLNDAGAVELRHTTVATNSGRGIYAFNGVVALTNSIVANNMSIVGDLGGFGTFDVSFSLIENPGGATVNDVTPGNNIFGQDPQLGVLQNNGGPTETQRPAPTSPVVNAGDPAFTPPPSNDQRGFARVAGGQIDMGAVELQAGTLQFSLTAASVAENAGTITIAVSRTGGNDGAVSVPIGVAGGGTAAAGTDYMFGGTTLSWSDGDAAEKTFDVTINDDLVVEGDETFILQLGAPTGGPTIGTNGAMTVTIIDNDAAVSAAIPVLDHRMLALLASVLAAIGTLALTKRT